MNFLETQYIEVYLQGRGALCYRVDDEGVTAISYDPIKMWILITKKIEFGKRHGRDIVEYVGVPFMVKTFVPKE